MSMHRIFSAVFIIALGSVLIAACSTKPAPSAEVSVPDAAAGPYGTAMDIAFAGDLWQALNGAGLAGSGAIQTYPYTGQSPHGEVLQYMDSTLTVNGQTGAVIVLQNYSGSGTDNEQDIRNVIRNPGRYLQSIAVMYKRPGYDAAHNNWFRVKYQPDGTPAKDGQGVALAGRIAKTDSSDNCVGCHAVAPGADGVFATNRIK